jgi:hypothetical protein
MANEADLIFDVYGIASRLPKFKVHFERGFLYIQEYLDYPSFDYRDSWFIAVYNLIPNFQLLSPKFELSRPRHIAHYIGNQNYI